MKRLMAILLVWALFLVPAVFAALETPTQINTTDKGTYTPTADNNAGLIQGGHVYEVNVDVETQTQHWAGIFGTIRKVVVLKDGTGTLFFQWGAGNPPYTVVYLSNSSSVDFAGQFLEITSDTDLQTTGVWSSIPTIETVANTYTGTEASTADANCAFADDGITGTEPANWRYVILPDPSADGDDWITCAAIYDADGSGTVNTGDAFLAAGNVDQDGGKAYDNTSDAHYEVLVPVENSIAYYVWVA